MTTLTFAISRALGRELHEGDEIVTTLLDHDANVAPWRALEERGVKVHAVKFRPEDCTLDLDDLQVEAQPAHQDRRHRVRLQRRRHHQPGKTDRCHGA